MTTFILLVLTISLNVFDKTDPFIKWAFASMLLVAFIFDMVCVGIFARKNKVTLDEDDY